MMNSLMASPPEHYAYVLTYQRIGSVIIRVLPPNGYTTAGDYQLDFTTLESRLVS